MAYLSACDVPMDDFLSLCKAFRWPKETFLVAFTPAEARFEHYLFDSDFLLQTEQGRIFCTVGELCWRNIGQVMRVVYLGDGLVPLKLPDCSSELAGLTRTERQFLLWGKRTNTQNEWLEQKVPHRFGYPISTSHFPGGRIALIVEYWSDNASLPKFTRYHSIVEVEGDKQHATK
ncbi:MAG: hypothetical protein ACOZF0_07215 [Thermodesulfobacteriota bacterium]